MEQNDIEMLLKSDATLKHKITNGYLANICFWEAIDVVNLHIIESILTSGSCSIYFHIDAVYGSYDKPRYERHNELSIHFSLAEDLENHLKKNELPFIEKRYGNNFLYCLNITLI